MKISYQWLQKYFDAPLPPPENVAEALTFHVFELESIEENEGDTVFDIKVTPNRGHDALSHRGIAKEISAILGIPLASDPLEGELTLTPLYPDLSIVIENPDLCHSYTAAILSGVEVKESPLWLKRRLATIGQRSINNVVDALNFVMFNVGQPLHAFDAGKLKEKDGKKAIFVRLPGPGESIETLDGVRRELPQTALLIADGVSGEGLGIAGIKGGKAAEIGGKTRDIIIESANFHGPSIRKTVQNLKLRTDASSRFEHGLSPALAPYALQSAVALVKQLCGGEIAGYVDAYPKWVARHTVSVPLSKINTILGPSLTPDEVSGIFDRLGFAYSLHETLFTVEAPKERLDIQIAEDLVEEVGRIYGYETISLLVPAPYGASVVNKRFFYGDRIREVLLQEGFSEIFTSSFRSRGEICMENALALGKGWLRSDLRENLDEALTRNVRNQDLLGLDAIQLFEIGTVFAEGAEHVSLALGARSSDRKWKVDERIRETLGKIEEALGIPIPAEPTSGIAEVELDRLLSALPDIPAYEKRDATPKTRFEPFSIYPFVLRDIALWTPKGTRAGDVEELLRREGGTLLARIRLFDTFEKGEKISYAFRLVFQSKERTLTDEEVNSLMEGVTKVLVGKAGFEVR